MMPRLLSFVVASLLLFAACGTGDATTNTNVPQATASTGVSETTVGADAPAATDAPTTEATAAPDGQTTVEPSGVEGPAAPNFSLALGDGSMYELSADSKPVYLVFWAEW